MSGPAMINDARFETRERDDGRGRDEPVEQHGNLMAPGGQDRARDSREFASAKRCCDAKRIARYCAVKSEPGIDRRALAHKHSIAAVVVLAMPISPTASRSLSGGTVRYPMSTAVRNSSMSTAGAAVTSRVGRSSSIGTTRRSAPQSLAIWLMAAPPLAKFATICAVTACG